MVLGPFKSGVGKPMPTRNLPHHAPQASDLLAMDYLQAEVGQAGTEPIDTRTTAANPPAQDRQPFPHSSSEDGAKLDSAASASSTLEPAEVPSPLVGLEWFSAVWARQGREPNGTEPQTSLGLSRLAGLKPPSAVVQSSLPQDQSPAMDLGSTNQFNQKRGDVARAEGTMGHLPASSPKPASTNAESADRKSRSQHGDAPGPLGRNAQSQPLNSPPNRQLAHSSTIERAHQASVPAGANRNTPTKQGTARMPKRFAGGPNAAPFEQLEYLKQLEKQPEQIRKLNQFGPQTMERVPMSSGQLRTDMERTAGSLEPVTPSTLVASELAPPSPMAVRPTVTGERSLPFSVSQMDQVVTTIADRVVSHPESQRLTMVLRGEALQGLEITIERHDLGLQVKLISQTQASGRWLADRHTQLQERLQAHVSEPVHLSVQAGGTSGGMSEGRSSQHWRTAHWFEVLDELPETQ